MINKFLKFVEENISSSDKVLLAVSGGVDSMVMCDLFNENKIPFSIAHCNFGLRGIESIEDEEFVKKIAKEYDVDIYIKNFDGEKIKNSKKSIQLIARELRYDWFNYLCEEDNFTKVALAHHMNDCIETTILNLCRGTGITGLSNMLNSNHKIIRPLILSTKQEIIDYANSKNVKWREDSSNAKNDYRRNIIRNKVMPILKSMNPSLESTFASSMDRINQVNYLWIEHLKTLKSKFFSKKENIYYIDFIAIKGESWDILALYELVKEFDFSYHQIKNFLECDHKPGARLLSKSHILYQNRGEWIIQKNISVEEKCIVDISKESNDLYLQGLEWSIAIIEASSYKIPQSSNSASLDIDLLEFPLSLRKWKEGDYFYPLGMKHKKKLSDFFIDNKISMVDKERVDVLVSGKDIVWVVGYRIDDRYKITASTKSVYEIRNLDTV